MRAARLVSSLLAVSCATPAIATAAAPPGPLFTIAGATGYGNQIRSGLAATRVRLEFPELAVDRRGAVVITSGYERRVWRRGLDGLLRRPGSTGSATSSGDGGAATLARLDPTRAGSPSCPTAGSSSPTRATSAPPASARSGRTA